MITTSDFADLIGHLITDEIVAHEPAQLETKLDFVNNFVRRHENKFKFCYLDDQMKQRLGESLSSSLSKCWSFLTKTTPSTDTSKDTALKPLTVSMASACLNFIRLVSRDAELIDAFENNDLLAQIQVIANLNARQLENLSLEDAPISVSSPLLESEYRDELNVNALKSISNLTYNSKHVQDFYAENGVGDAITMHLKQFNPAAYSLSSPANDHKFNIMIFNLRILFLLTIFNKKLRQKLKEQLEVIIYLIEIIDQIMKERLNVNVEDATVLLNNCVSLSNGSDQSDFCYLKPADIEYIIEILKILFNLTMDISSVKANAAATMGTYGRNPPTDDDTPKRINCTYFFSGLYIV